MAGRAALKNRPGRPSGWDDKFYVTAYRLAKGGADDLRIAGKLGVDPDTFGRWKEVLPALKDALQQARAGRDEAFRDYVYGRLPADLQELWDRIDAVDSDSGGDRIDAILQDRGDTVRQHLFLYALVHCDFNPSLACSKLNIHGHTFNRWKRDPDFLALMDGINEHKGNFFEGHLVRLVSQGDTAATIHANKTFNKGRGYGETVKVVGGGPAVVNNVNVINFGKLNLSPAAGFELYQAVKRLQLERAAAALPAPPPPIDNDKSPPPAPFVMPPRPEWVPDGAGVPPLDLEEMEPDDE